MTELRIVAKAMNDLADEWHWVVLHDAQELEPRRYFVSSADTICGLLVVDRPRAVRLYDMGAPDEPTCPRCLEGGVPAGLIAEIEELLRETEEAEEPATAPAG